MNKYLKIGNNRPHKIKKNTAQVFLQNLGGKHFEMVYVEHKNRQKSTYKGFRQMNEVQQRNTPVRVKSTESSVKLTLSKFIEKLPQSTNKDKELIKNQQIEYTQSIEKIFVEDEEGPSMLLPPEKYLEKKYKEMKESTPKRNAQLIAAESTMNIPKFLTLPTFLSGISTQKQESILVSDIQKMFPSKRLHEKLLFGHKKNFKIFCETAHQECIKVLHLVLNKIKYSVNCH